jgi:hypothetical protein
MLCSPLSSAVRNSNVARWLLRQFAARRLHAGQAAWFVAMVAGLIAQSALAAANSPPSVSLTSPSNGASFTTPATITLTATASDSDGSVTKVDFYRGTATSRRSLELLAAA